MSHTVLQEADLIRRGFRTPRAAAIAGILFSLLMMGSMLLIKTSIPSDPLTAAADVMTHSKRISFGLNLLPFAGICFLWFVGVLRDRIGKLEDRLSATVFFGSALLFLAMIFAAGAVAAGILRLLASGSESLMGPGLYALGRVGIYQVMHVYAIRMAGVFMISTSTIALRTRIVPRWMGFLGFALALALLLSNGTIDAILLVFPLWVLSISVHIMIDNFRGVSGAAAASVKE